MTDLAALVVRLEAETSRYASELERAQKKLKKFEDGANVSLQKVAKFAAGAAVAAATGFAAMAKSAIDAADNLNDLSKTLGISTEFLSQLQFAAEQSGTDLEGLTTGLRKFSSVAADAATKSGTARDSLTLIGVSATDARGKLKPTEQLLLDVAEQFSKYDDGLAKSAAAQDLFGRSGAALIPFLNEGRGGIEKLLAKADELGLTLSTKTAVAADEFNDSLGRIKSSLSGATLGVVSKLLPALTAIAGELERLATDKAGARGFVDGLAASFKFLVATAAALANTFGDVGRGLGALFAASDQLRKFNVTEALSILKQANADAAAEDEKLNAFYKKLYDERVEIVKAAADEINSAGSGSGTPTSPFPSSPTAAASALQEIEIKIKKIDTSETDKFYKSLEEQTRTQEQIQLAAYFRDKVANEALLEAKIIQVEEYNQRQKEALDELLPEFEVTAKRVTTSVKQQSDSIVEFQRQAARNTQDIISQSLLDGFEGGARGILSSFADMLRQLAAQALAAKIAEKIFGNQNSTGGGVGGSGLFGLLAGAAKSYFAGGKASGGDVMKDRAYLVGERRPEVFVPDRNGSIIANPQMAAAGPVNVPLQVINVDDPNRIPNFFKTEKGSKTFLNMITDNQSVIRRILQG